MALADDAARARIRADLDTTLIVEAAAGTGKTTELVTRILAVIMAGEAELERVVAVTFTEAAAGELKLRLRTEIERARGCPETDATMRARLDRALPQLEQARIGTIHSFCADLLREHPVAARVDPLFEVAADEVAAGAFDRAFGRWFERQLEHPTEAVRRLLRRRGRGENGPRARLRYAAWELCERRDFDTPWRHQPFERETEIEALMDEIAALGAMAAAGDPEDWFTKSLAILGRFAAEHRRREAVRGRDVDALEAALVQLVKGFDAKHWGWKGSPWKIAPGFPKDELRERRARLHERIERFAAAAGADLAPKLRDALWEVVETYASIKERAGCLDFIDLLVRARNVVRDDATVRADLQDRFTHVFVDEFQDTDPLQVELLLLLAADDPAERDWRRVRPVPGKLFLVADPKQSIYRFRRADVALYETVKAQLLAAGAALVHLRVSFRAVPEIQEAVNAAFARRLAGDSPSQARYVALEPQRSGNDDQPAVVVLPVPAPYGDFAIFDRCIDASLPDAVAAFVTWLLRESGWTVTERERPGVRVPIQPRHVCLLFRRFRAFDGDATRPYVRALEARHLPHVLLGGSAFHTREEVEALRNALTAIERPEDELTVFATLRGPLFAIGDAALLAFRSEIGSLHPFRRAPEGAAELPEPLRDVIEALALLRDLHRRRNHRPIADTIARLLEATRAHAGLANWPTGEQALANVTRLMDLARRAERRGVTSFRQFVERLWDDAERNAASEAPIVEESTDGVRIMTVHRAKGLEFPVVILVDLTTKEIRAQQARWVDPERRLCAIQLAGCSPQELLDHEGEERERELEEAARLLYVATTRARDLLVVPAIGDQPYDGWLAALHPVLYPEAAHARVPESRTPAGCPTLGVDTVLVRPDRISRPPGSVMPGRHVPIAGRHRVVWWDPKLLALGAPETVGLRQQRLLEADDGRARSEAGLRAHAAWQAERTAVRRHGATPLRRIVTATELAATAPAAIGTLTAVTRETRVDVESIARLPARPRGKRFGSLVHAVLAVVELDAGRDAVAAAAAVEGRLLGAAADEVGAAVGTVVGALAHPLLRAAAAAERRGACRRESPITLRLDDGTLVEGIVDVAYREDDGWIVIDVKTDAELGARVEEYRAQVGVYAAAVSRSTGLPARAVLLRV